MIKKLLKITYTIILILFDLAIPKAIGNIPPTIELEINFGFEQDILMLFPSYINLQSHPRFLKGFHYLLVEQFFCRLTLFLLYHFFKCFYINIYINQFISQTFTIITDVFVSFQDIKTFTSAGSAALFFLARKIYHIAAFHYIFSSVAINPKQGINSNSNGQKL